MPRDGTTWLHGEFQTGAQVHFYLETNSALAIPGTYDEVVIHSSTQNPNGDQAQIARCAGVKANQVTIRFEQIGGGFGGKQNRAVFTSAMAAVAARRFASRSASCSTARPTPSLWASAIPITEPTTLRSPMTAPCMR